MAVPTTSPGDLQRHLTDLGVAAGAHVAVHSRLLSFGQIVGGVESVHDALNLIIGAEGTIIVPTYTMAKGTIYDADKTAPQGVGAYADFVLTRPGRTRSACPMHNHAGIGARASVLAQSDGAASFGPGSDFDYMLQADFQLLLLGTTLTEGATFIHHIEAMAKVPYREWMEFQRRCVDSNGNLVAKTCHYFGRPAASRAQGNLDLFEAKLLAAGVLRRVDTHFGASRLIRLRDFFDFGMIALQRDPYSMVRMS